jgi:hypothetical protein
VCWGKPPSKSSDPILTSQQNQIVAKLLGTHATAVDLCTYHSDENLAAAFSANLAWAPQPSFHSTAAKGKLGSNTPDSPFVHADNVL